MRLGIMSFAHLHAEAYIQNLRVIPDVEMIGFADDDPERGKHFAQGFNARLFDSYGSLLAEKPDGVIVCSENSRHAPLVQMAAEAGVHILSEKPLATSLEDAQAMLDVCRKNGVFLMTAFELRFNVPALEIKKLVDSGGLGQIYGCNTTNQGECPRHHRAWFVDKTLAGGGAVMDHTVHLADLLRWYLGCEVIEVYAQTNSILYSDQNLDVETGGLIMLTFENGTFASIDCSWSKPPYYPTWGGLKMELVGEKGLATMDAFRQTMTVYSHKTQRPAWAYWGSDAKQGMMNEFAAAIREKRSPSVTGYDGYKALEIALAAYRSAESGQPVGLK
jgi:predicted dehydrogenase